MQKIGGHLKHLSVARNRHQRTATDTISILRGSLYYSRLRLWRTAKVERQAAVELFEPADEMKVDALCLYLQNT